VKKLFSIVMVLLLASNVDAAKTGGGGGGRSFSGGSSRPSASPSRSYSGGRNTSYSANPSRSYSGGNTNKTSSTKTTPTSTPSGKNVSIKPTTNTFDTIGTKEQMKAESRRSYDRGAAPKTEYKAPNGKTEKIDTSKVEKIRNMDESKWVNRQERLQVFNVYHNYPTVVYSDPYPSYFWWWMLDRSLEERAMWAYCHRADMDKERYRAMLAKDAALESRIKQLERQQVKQDPTYTPKGIDTDLMYSNEYVDAVYNPQMHSSFVTVMLWIFGLTLAGVIIWAVFFRELKGV
jgi:hypothetical protein